MFNVLSNLRVGTIFALSMIVASGCFSQTHQSERGMIPSDPASDRDRGWIETESVNSGASSDAIAQSWQAYRQRFIQPDGRVIDREAQDRTTSEGQAYAMLRAVLIDDAETFALTLQWAEDNLRRKAPNEQPEDQLWAWQWGKRADNSWGILDHNFASDADIDAITALIVASRRWNRPDYLALAQRKLVDLWAVSTLEAVSVEDSSATLRYLLPGPMAAFTHHANHVYLNPSYMAPYAFRLFAQVDPERDWLSLVESSYVVLETASQRSTTQLPSDWVVLNTKTGQIQLDDTGDLKSVYSFDAYRVWWRLKLDALWFDEPRATAYLQSHLAYLVELWQSQQFIPARIAPSGRPLSSYESTAQYAMLYFGLQDINNRVAQQIRSQKLEPNYQDGFWDNNSAYYVQNLGWFAFYPFDQVTMTWLRAQADLSAQSTPTFIEPVL